MWGRALGLAVMAACSTDPVPSASLDRVPYGQEFWHRSTGEVDIGRALERVDHAIQDGPEPWVRARTYEARFPPAGLTLLPGGATDGAAASFVTVAAAGRPWLVEGNTAQRDVPDLGLLEHVETGRDGVEVTWVIPARPEEPVAIAAQLTGMRLLEDAADGLHFAHQGTSRLRLGRAVAVDSAGQTWPIAVDATPDGERTSLVFRVPAEILAAATYPLAIDPILGPEVGIGTPVLVATGDAHDPVIAVAAGMTFVAWIHDGWPGLSVDTAVATRLDAAGNILDPGGILVFDFGFQVDVASNGGDFLVTDGENVKVVTTDGAVSGAHALGTFGSASNARLTTDGSRYLAVWEDDRNEATSGTDVYAARVDADGTILDAGGFAVVTAPFDQHDVSLTYFRGDVHQYYVVWQEDADWGGRIEWARIRPSDGAVELLGPPVLGPGGGYRPVIASDGDDRMMLIMGLEENASGLLFGQFFNEDGGAMWNAWETDNFALWRGPRPSLAGLDGIFLAAWGVPSGFGNGGYLLARRIAIGPLNFPLYGESTPIELGTGLEPHVVSDGADFIVASQSASPGSIYQRRVARGDGAVGPSTLLSVEVHENRSKPVLAAASDRSLLAWYDLWAEPSGVYAARVGHSDGAVLDGTPILLGEGSFAVSLDAASNGTGFLVVWVQSGSVLAARLGLDGSVLDTTPLVISSAGSQAHVASDGVDYLVMWNYNDGIARTRSVVVHPDGSVEAPVSHAALGGFEFDLASDGSGYLAAVAAHSVSARILDPTGALVATRTLAGNTAEAGDVSAASDGEDYLVAWSTDSILPDRVFFTNVMACHVSPAGDAGPTLALATATGTQREPRAASDGRDYLVTWRTAYKDFEGTVRGVRQLGDDGRVIGGGSAPGDQLGQERATAQTIAAIGERRYLLAYLRPQLVARVVTYDNDPPYAAPGSITTAEDTPRSFKLPARDGDGNALTYSFDSLPVHGTLTGTAPNLVYTPAANYYGPDSLTYRANDGRDDSGPGTVSITVTAVNDRPVATLVSTSTLEDTPVDLVLVASDVEGDPLTFEIVESPEHGVLEGTPPNVRYVPELNFEGHDDFKYRACDPAICSAFAIAAVHVTEVNDPPVAIDQVVSTAEDQPVFFTLGGNDVEDDPDELRYDIVSPPAHGDLLMSGAGGPPVVGYVPDPDFNGSDELTFQVRDRRGATATGVVAISVTPVNDAPVVANTRFTTNEDTAVAIAMVVTDVDGPAATFAVTLAPAHGSLTGDFVGPTAYTPAPNYFGTDRIEVAVSDGEWVVAGAIDLEIVSVDDPPVAEAGADALIFRGETVTFDGGSSYDIDSAIVRYDWTFGDGGTGTGSPSTHAYLVPGTYTAVLQVTDAEGASATDSAAIVVLSPLQAARLLYDTVVAMALRGSGRSLEVQARGVVDALVQGRSAATVRSLLGAFIATCNSSTAVTPDQRTLLVSLATRVIASL